MPIGWPEGWIDFPENDYRAPGRPRRDRRGNKAQRAARRRARR